jgi:non-specific serine/threonine protein kinase
LAKVLLYVQTLRTLVRALVRAREIQKAIPYAEKAVATAPLHEELCRDLMQLYSAAGQPSLALQQFRVLEERLQQELGERPAASTRSLAREISERLQEAPPVRAAVAPSHSSPVVAQPVFPTGMQTLLAIRHKSLSEELRATLRQMARLHGGDEAPGRAEFWWALFARAADAVACAFAICRSPAVADMGSVAELCFAIHTGEVGHEAQRSEVKQHLSALLNAAHTGQILCSEESAVFLRRSLESGARLRDLGRWRLRDQEAPTLLFEVRRQEEPDGGYPPPKAARAHQPALPMQFSRFFGREEELGQLRTLFGATHPARLVTLTGPGGTGKTRLAVEAGQQLADTWAGAVCFVPLASVQEPERIVEAILDALKQPRNGGMDPLTQLCESLNAHPTLLVLDNLEQIAEGAAQIVASLLERAPALSCLATSRRLLNIAAEQELPVLPLPVPTAGTELERQILCESVRLFVDRAQIARPDFQVTPHNAAAVAELCVRLEGLPLALELAAARAMVLSPAQMLAQLENRFAFLTSRRKDVAERQRSLRGAIEWSYRLLDPELQQLFARLSVFRDGWTLEDAEAVCGGSETLDALCQLQECSLLRAETAPDGDGLRFRMLEALQAFGNDQLEAGEREALRERHAITFADCAEQAASHLRREFRAEWMGRLEQERENLRAALTYLLDADRITDAARMCAALSEFWERRGWIREGAAFVGRCLTAPQPVEDRVVLRRLLSAAGWFAYLQGCYSEALAWQQRNLAECTQANDGEGECIALNNLGLIAQAQGEDDEAWRHFEASLALARVQGHRARQAARLSNLGLLAIQMRRYTEAQRALEEALSIYRSDNYPNGIAACLCNLGKLAIYQERYVEALALAGEGMRLFHEAQNRSGIAYTLANLGLAHTLSGDEEGATADLLKALAICKEIGLHSLVPVLLETLARCDAARARYPSAVFALTAAERLRNELRTPRSTLETEVVAVAEERLRTSPPTAEQIASRAHAQALTLDQILTRILEPPSGDLP